MSHLVRNIFLLTLLLFLVGVLVWFVFLKENISQKDSDLSLLPSGKDNTKVVTRDPNLSPDQTDQFRIEYGKIRDLLPYEDNGVRVTYDENLGFITARIKDVATKAEFLAKKLTVETLFKDRGVNDLCGLAITWYGPEDLKLDIKDQLSPGCTT